MILFLKIGLSLGSVLESCCIHLENRVLPLKLLDLEIAFDISLSKDVKISILGDFCWSVVLTADLG